MLGCCDAELPMLFLHGRKIPVVCGRISLAADSAKNNRERSPRSIGAICVRSVNRFPVMSDQVTRLQLHHHFPLSIFVAVIGDATEVLNHGVTF